MTKIKIKMDIYTSTTIPLIHFDYLIIFNIKALTQTKLYLYQQVQQCRYNLTMTQPLKIRKNRSLKEIRYDHSKCLLPPNNLIAPRDITHKHSTKYTHLQPLPKIKDTSQCYKKAQIKLDYTQPVNIKNDYSSKQDCLVSNTKARDDGIKPLKHFSLDKENRPASMNELKHPSVSKARHTFYNTDKFDSMKMFHPILQHKIESDSTEVKIIQKQNSRVKVGKSHSRTRLLRLTQKEQLTKTQNQGKTDIHSFHLQQFSQQKNFRKNIIEQIFNKAKVKLPLKTENTKPQQQIREKTQSLAESIITQHEREESPSASKKIERIFHADCSTIKEKQERNSSFISKKAYCQLTKNLQDPSPFQIDKTQAQKRKKIDVDKFRKKFPQNFFK